MSTKIQAPYGTWVSPITAELLVSGAAGINEVIPDNDAVWWAESRPDEGGRVAVMKHQGQHSQEMTPTQANVRTLIHEYGGGAWWAQDDTLWYVDYSDQRIRKLQAGGLPLLLSPEPEQQRALRYADLRPSSDNNWIICVTERHSPQLDEPQNLLMAIANDGSLKQFELATGADFYASPCLSPDGKQLAWIEWHHPNMPWDDTSLMIADVMNTETSITLANARSVAGGKNESVIQPSWSPDGQLHYLSDKNDLWHLYKLGKEDAVIAVDGEIGYPPWVHGLSRYAFTNNAQVTAAVYKGGVDHLNNYEDLTSFSSIRTSGDKLAFVGASWSREATVYFDGQVIRKPRDLSLSKDFTPPPEVITFPSGTDGQDEAHALYYAPANPAYQLPNNEKPPLIVLAHGGPTSAARSQLSLAQRFWTSRGIAVVDVNYRGSSGFGRRYRKKLDGQWGVADVQDCVAAAQYLAKRGDVDAERLIIRGGSAGGFTVLSALALYETFTAGASLYGVADLEALANDTHKFESRYLDSLIGAWPADAAIYAERSPINHLDGFSVPMIVLQGADDAVVPPNQSRMIVEALDKRGIQVAYIEFEGEQHGFRKAETIIKATQSELTFYGQVFGFEPEGDTTEIDIRNS